MRNKTVSFKTKSRQKSRKAIAEELILLLASSYSVYLKTQNFHWNVTGPQFYSLHILFDEQYKELAEAVDVIAEHIRALGYSIPASFTEFSKLAKVKDAIGKKKSESMIYELLEDHRTIVDLIREAMDIARDCEDEGTQDLLTERWRAHEKNAWMLQSLLD